MELRARLWETLAPDVEYHMIAFYGDRTQRGDPLPDPVIDPRCRGIKVVLNGPSSWHREQQQRDAIGKLRYEFKHYDLILLTDADEIVDPRRIDQIAERATPHNAFVKLQMTMYMFGSRWVFPDPWRHPGAFFARNMPLYPTVQVRLDLLHAAVGAAGWHFSYVGDIGSKLKACAHEEYDSEYWLGVFEEARRTGKLGDTKLYDLPLGGVAGDLFREIVG